MSSIRFGVIVVALMASAATASAQRPEGGRFGGGMARGIGAAMLLRQEAVQKELGLSAEQKEQLADLAAGQQRGGDRPNLREMSQEERQAWMAEMQERMEQNEKKIGDILSEEQRDRLKQIRLQVLGVNAMNDPEFAKDLGLTEEQREKLSQLRERVRQARQDGGNGDNLRDRLTNALKDLLTPEQKEKLESLRGKPFDTSSLQLGERRRD